MVSFECCFGGVFLSFLVWILEKGWDDIPEVKMTARNIPNGGLPSAMAIYSRLYTIVPNI